MKMTSEQFEEHKENGAGYCLRCDAITSLDVEPEDEGCECQDCKNLSVMGVEAALTLEKVEIVDELEDEDEDEGFEFRRLEELD